MTEKDRQFLAQACTELEARFSGVVAAYQGFVAPLLGGPRDGYLVIEVFNARPESTEDVLTVGEELAGRYFDEGGAATVFNVWTPEQTAARFSEDVAAILAASAPEQEVAVVLHCDLHETTHQWCNHGGQELTEAQTELRKAA